MGSAVHYSTEERQKLLEAFEQSGLRANEFARQNGLDCSLFYVWLSRYMRVPAAAEPTTVPATVPLKEIRLDQVLGQSGWAAELVLPDGLILRLDAQAVGQLLPQLQKRLRA